MRLWLDVLNGFPSIVIGIFVFTMVVKTKVPVLGIGHHQSAIAGGFALAIIMLPLVARATMEVLALVPNDLREASYALGVSKWQTVLRVVLPTVVRRHPHRHDARDRPRCRRDGAAALHLRDRGTDRRLEPGALGAVDPARRSSRTPSRADPNLHDQAWAAAFVLIVFVLVTSLTARFLLDRSRRKLGLR